MPLGVKRCQQEGDDHFITFSCYNRRPYLDTPTSKDIFLDSLERTRRHYQFEVLGYVVMDGWPTSDYPATNRVPHISILRCGHSRKARTRYPKINPRR